MCNKFIKIFFLIVVFLVITQAVYMESFAKKLLSMSDENFNKHKNMIVNEIKNRDINIVSFGDSHISRGIDINSTFFNLAYASENVLDIYLKLLYVNKINIKPKVILLQADYHTFSSYRAISSDLTKKKWLFSEKFMQFIDEFNNKFEKKLFYDEKKSDFLEKIGLLQFKREISSNLHITLLNSLRGKEIKKSSKILENGTIVSYKNWLNLDKIDRNMNAKIRFNSQLKKGKLFEEDAIYIYNKIVNFAKERDIRVVMIKFPMTNEYLKLLNSHVDIKDKVDNFYLHLSKKYDIEILNYVDLFKNHQEYFEDEDHLNYKGAKELGSKLVYDLKLNNLMDIR